LCGVALKQIYPYHSGAVPSNWVQRLFVFYTALFEQSGAYRQTSAPE
jgi:hypothetical protein